MRSVLSSVLGEVGVGEQTRPKDLAESLELDTTLAWKTARFLRAPTPFDAAQYIPGTSGLGIVVSAAERAGASWEAVSRARLAIDEFKRFVETEAGDRSSFNAMLAGHAARNRRRAELDLRKKGYQANRYVLGAEAKVHFSAAVVRWGEGGDTLRYMAIRGFVGLKRLRRCAAWRISSTVMTDDVNHLVRRDLARRPIDPDVASMPEREQVPLLTRFCSEPLPRLRRIDSNDGRVDFELCDGEVGNAGAMTCVTGEIVDLPPPEPDADGRRSLEYAIQIRTPCELRVCDIFVHRDLFPNCPPSVNFHTTIFADHWGFRPSDQLPFYEQIEALGSGLGKAASPDVPRHGELLRFAFTQVGWNPDEFLGHRFRMEYPPVPTRVTLAWNDLPAP